MNLRLIMECKPKNCNELLLGFTTDLDNVFCLNK